jgi:GlpG protein
LTLVVIIACLAIYCAHAIGLPIFDELTFHPTLASSPTGRPGATSPRPSSTSRCCTWCSTCCGGGISGGQIEQLGSGKLFILLSSSALPNIAEFFASGPRFGGLSGVVYALLGYSWLRQAAAGLAASPCRQP